MAESGRLMIEWDDHDKVLAVLLKRHGYQESVMMPGPPGEGGGGMVPNPESPEDFLARIFAQGVAQMVADHDAEIAGSEARASAWKATFDSLGLNGGVSRGETGPALKPIAKGPTGQLSRG